MSKSSSKMIFLGTNIEEKAPIRNDDILIVFELEEEERLSNLGYNVISFHRHAQKLDIWRKNLEKAQQWWNSWSKNKIDNGKSIIEILKFEDTSLWWFVHSILWQRNNGPFDTIYQIETIISLIEKHNPKTIEVYGKIGFPLVEILKEINEKYEFQILDKSIKIEILHKNKIISNSKIKLLFKIGLLKIIKNFSKKKNGNIAILSWKGGTISKVEGKKIADDQYFIGLENYFEKNHEKINFLYLDRKLQGENNEFTKILKNTVNGKYEHWMSYYSLKGLKNAYNKYKDTKEIFLKIENNQEFIDSMKYNGIDIYPFLRHLFVSYLPILIGFSLIEIDATTNFLKKNNPRKIMTVDGFGVVGSALNYVCFKRNIQTIMPQLGTIYVENVLNQDFLIKDDYDKRLLPQIFSWGPYFSELIFKMKYPKTYVKQTGFWRTDIKENNSKIENYIFYIAGSDKREYLQSIDEEIFTIHKIHGILPKNFKLMVKLHPTHDVEYYSKKLSKLKNIILIKNNSVDVNDLIQNSSLVIGKVSTLIIQSMIISKPIIIVNLAGEVNFLGFKDIPFVTDISKLSEKITEFTHNEIKITYDIKNYCNPIGNESVEKFVSELIDCKETDII